jgi:hypothetical protein
MTPRGKVSSRPACFGVNFASVSRPGLFRIGHRRLLAPRSGLCPHRTLPCPPYIHAARFPQQKIFKDKLPFASNKRLVADPARYFQIDGLRARWSFDNLIQGKAAFAAEKRNSIRVRHVNDIPAIVSTRRSYRSWPCMTVR